jgi:hypothetical protein
MMEQYRPEGMETVANARQEERAMSIEEQKTQPTQSGAEGASKYTEAHSYAQLKHEAPKASRLGLLTLVVVVLIVAVLLGVVGIGKRQHASAQLAQYTNTAAAPTVELEQPVMQATAQEIVVM